MLGNIAPQTHAWHGFAELTAYGRVDTMWKPLLLSLSQ